MEKTPSPTLGPGRFHSESMANTYVEDHLLTKSGSSLRLTVWFKTRDQVATLSLWVSYCRVSTRKVSHSSCIRDSLHRSRNYCSLVLSFFFSELVTHLRFCNAIHVSPRLGQIVFLVTEDAIPHQSLLCN